jgi:hypothetical protein
MNPEHSLPGGLPVSRVLFLAIAFLLGSVASGTAAEQNLLRNGDLKAGEGLPAYWEAHAVRTNEVNQKFSWDSKTGQVGVTIGKSYDSAAWQQTLGLAPGWYCLRGEVRVSKSRPDYDVAMFGVEAGKPSRSFGWTADSPNGWSRGTLYFKVGGPIKDVTVVCRLTGSTASVSCRDFSLTRLDVPPPAGVKSIDFQEAAEYELTRARKLGVDLAIFPPAAPQLSFSTPVGRWNWVLAVMLVGITLAGISVAVTFVALLRNAPKRDFRSLITNPRLLASFVLPLCFVTLVVAYVRLSFVYPKSSDDAIFVLQAKDIHQRQRAASWLGARPRVLLYDDSPILRAWWSGG